MIKILKRFSYIALIILIDCYGAQPTFVAPFAPEAKYREAMQRSSLPNKAVVYFYRKLGPDPTLRTILSIDGSDAACMVTGSFVRVELDPGRHNFLLQTEAIKNQGNDPKKIKIRPGYDSSLELDVLRGGSYYININPIKGNFWQNCYDFKKIEPEIGAREIENWKCKLLEMPMVIPHKLQ